MKAKRLKFALDHRHWTVSDWKQVFFQRDLNPVEGKWKFLRRRPGEAYLPECVVSTTKHPVKIMVFGAVTPRVKSKLIFINGNVDASKYQKFLSRVFGGQFAEALPMHGGRSPGSPSEENQEMAGRPWRREVPGLAGK